MRAHAPARMHTHCLSVPNGPGLVVFSSNIELINMRFVVLVFCLFIFEEIFSQN